MTTAKTESPYYIKKRPGRGIKPSEAAVLRLVEDKLSKGGYQVLGSLFARVPGLLKFFATTYRRVSPDSLPPFGVTAVNFLNNGDVTVKVMGCEVGEGENPRLDLKWDS